MRPKAAIASATMRSMSDTLPMSAWIDKPRRPMRRDGRRRLLGALAVDVDGHDIGPGCRQGQRRRLADALAGTRHQRDPVGQLHPHLLLT